LLFVVVLLFDVENVWDVVWWVFDEDFGGFIGVDVIVLVMILFE